MGWTPHVYKAATAATTEASYALNCKEIKLLANDSASIDLIVNFDEATTGTNAFTLKAGETIQNWKVNVGTIFYKTGSSTAAFRCIGTRQDDK
jgi:hypothetical protein